MSWIQAKNSSDETEEIQPESCGECGISPDSGIRMRHLDPRLSLGGGWRCLPCLMENIGWGDMIDSNESKIRAQWIEERTQHGH